MLIAAPSKSAVVRSPRPDQRRTVTGPRCLRMTETIPVQPEKVPGQEAVLTVVSTSVTPVTSMSHDGVRLHGVHHKGENDLAFVVGHGFTNNVAKPYVARL